MDKYSNIEPEFKAYYERKVKMSYSSQEPDEHGYVILEDNGSFDNGPTFGAFKFGKVYEYHRYDMQYIVFDGKGGKSTMTKMSKYGFQKMDSVMAEREIRKSLEEQAALNRVNVLANLGNW